MQVIGLIMQMDLDVQLQRCLNTEAYSRAKDVRTRRSKVCDRGEMRGAWQWYQAKATMRAACLQPACSTASTTRLAAGQRRKAADAGELRVTGDLICSARSCYWQSERQVRGVSNPWLYISM